MNNELRESSAIVRIRVRCDLLTYRIRIKTSGLSSQFAIGLSKIESNEYLIHFGAAPISLGAARYADVKVQERTRCLGAGTLSTGRCGACRETDVRDVILPRKEVIQPHLPVRLPCYDFTPLTLHTFDASRQKVGPAASGADDSGGVTGGVYKARERIHRGVLIRDY